MPSRRIAVASRFGRSSKQRIDRTKGSSQAMLESLESRCLLSAAAAPIISSLTDSFTGTSVDTSKWAITNRGIENNGPAGYDAPTEDPTNGLTLGGTTNNQYWYGSSLESNGLFSSALPTTVSVERVALNGNGSAFRSSLWILQPNSGGQFLHFAQDVNETGWQYNQTGGGSGTAIASFNNAAGDQGDHVMKLVYTPLGGNQANVDMYLDGALGATAHFNNWDITQPFEVIVTGQARAIGDQVTAQFKNFDAEAATPSTTAPAAPTNLTATANGTQVNLSWTDNASDEIAYHVERSIDGTNFTDIATVPGMTGTGGTVTYTDVSADVGTTYTYRVRAFNDANGGTFSAYSNTAKASTAAALTSLTDPFTGTSVDTTKWNITTRGIENTGDAGYDAPTESPTTGLTLGGTTQDQYW